MTELADEARQATASSGESLARRALANERRLWAGLFRWISRRPEQLGSGAETFSYADALTPIMAAFIIGSMVEIVAVHLVLPWRIAQYIALVLGVYGLLWMVAMLAGIRVHPHVTTPSGLRIRHGTMFDQTIPWAGVASVHTRLHSLNQGSRIQVDRDKSRATLHVTVSQQTNIDITLRNPIDVVMPNGTVERIDDVRMYADDAKALLAHTKAILAAAHHSTGDAS